MSSSFLSVGVESIPLGGPDLGQLLYRARIATPIGTRAVVGDPRPLLLRRRLTADISRPVLRPALRGMSAAVVYAQEQAAKVPAFNIQHISEGRFTEKTIDNMHKAVLSAKTDSRWRETMENIRRTGRDAGAIGWKDWLGEVKWFNSYFRGPHFIDYVRDPHQVELVMHPWHTFIKRLGDCDDSSTLWAGAMGSLGAAHKFRTYKADPRRPNDWSHVVAQIWVPGQGWVNNDLTIKSAFPGFEPEGFPFKDWHEPKW
jgi:hypothetical protein